MTVFSLQYVLQSDQRPSFTKDCTVVDAPSSELLLSEPCLSAAIAAIRFTYLDEFIDVDEFIHDTVEYPLNRRQVCIIQLYNYITI